MPSNEDMRESASSPAETIIMHPVAPGILEDANGTRYIAEDSTTAYCKACELEAKDGIELGDYNHNCKKSAVAPADERENMLHDLDHKPLRVVISADGKKLWINDSAQCIFRAQNIGELEVEDSRAPAVSGRTQGDLSKLAEECADAVRNESNPDFFGVTILEYLERAALRESAREAPSKDES